MREWWVNDVGINLLKGVWDDEENPPKLSDETIIDLLRRIPDARESFNRLYPTMLPEEQARLDVIAEGAEFVIRDYKTLFDDFQRRQNTVGIHTTGPHGGSRFGGNQG